MDEILIVDYDSAWPERYRREVERLEAVLPPGVLTRWEHFGSTAVPGLAAKPVIDILAEVSSLAEAIERAIPVLEAEGYSWWRDNPKKDHLFLVRGLPPNGPRSHHLHLLEKGHPSWDRLLFRDGLRADPVKAREYARLKRELAVSHAEDREAYTQAKTDFVREFTDRQYPQAPG